MMVVDPTTLGRNLYLIIGAVLLLLILLSVVIAVWTGVNVAFWRRAQKRSAAEDKRRRIGPDGRPYPPAARGLCDRCHRVDETVYHLPSGERRCPACYADVKKGSA
jgi:hypothetical protein